jgi:hypothetical protein
LWRDPSTRFGKFSFSNTAGCLEAFGSATGIRAKSIHQQKPLSVPYEKQNPVCQLIFDFSASRLFRARGRLKLI